MVILSRMGDMKLAWDESDVEKDAGPRLAPVSAEPGARPRFIAEFDGLRGLAVAGVILFHSREQLISSGLEVVARYGWIGVNLFFVLSGFLITEILVRARSRPHFFRDFYARRALRIWPLYFALLILTAMAARVRPGLPLSQAILHTRWLPFALLVQNIFLATLPGPLIPTWTLAIEEQFYLFWAPVVRFIGKRPLVWVLAAVLIASPILRLALAGHVLSTNTLLNLDGLAAGSLLALLYRPDRRTLWTRIALALMLLGAAVLAWCRFESVPLLASGLASFFAGLVILTLLLRNGKSLYARFLRLRWLMYLGAISYGLYLLHSWAAVVVAAAGADRLLAPLGVAGDLGVVALRFAASIAFAAISWHWFESPLLQLRQRFREG
jgi:peptidoglycan/LPS O-acetylase OafA/YrhL